MGMCSVLSPPTLSSISSAILSTRRDPESREMRSGLVGAVMRKWDGSYRYEGSIRDEVGRDYLFRVRKFSHDDGYSGYSLLLSSEDDFAQDVRTLQIRGII